MNLRRPWGYLAHYGPPVSMKQEVIEGLLAEGRRVTSRRVVDHVGCSRGTAHQNIAEKGIDITETEWS